MVRNYYSPTLEDALLSHDNCGSHVYIYMHENKQHREKWQFAG